MPQFVDGDWLHLESLIGAALDSGLRAMIERTANNYVVARQFSTQGIIRRATRGKSKANGGAKTSTPAWRLLRAMDQLVARWNEAGDDADLKDILVRYDAAPQKGHQDLHAIIGDVQFHRIALRLRLRETDDPDPLVNLVGNLAHIYRNATGKVPTISLSRDGKETPSPFVELVQEIDATAPEPARHPGEDSSGAWHQAVRRALNKYNERGKLPQRP